VTKLRGEIGGEVWEPIAVPGQKRERLEGGPKFVGNRGDPGSPLNLEEKSTSGSSACETIRSEAPLSYRPSKKDGEATKGKKFSKGRKRV